MAFLSRRERLAQAFGDAGRLRSDHDVNAFGPRFGHAAGTQIFEPARVHRIARHHADALLLDVALAAERYSPWPLVAPGVMAPTRAS